MTGFYLKMTGFYLLKEGAVFGGDDDWSSVKWKSKCSSVKFCSKDLLAEDVDH